MAGRTKKTKIDVFDVSISDDICLHVFGDPESLNNAPSKLTQKMMVFLQT
jgi:hypothetical protein